MKKMKKMKKGFTLIELMIVVGLIGIMVPVIYSVFDYGMLGYRTGAGQVEIFRAAQPVILLLQNDIRAGIRVVDEFSGFKTSKNSLVLEKEDSYVCYYSDKKILTRRVIAKVGNQKEAQRLSRCLKGITFDYSKKPFIAFKLLFLQKVRGKETKLGLASGVTMRNWREE